MVRRTKQAAEETRSLILDAAEHVFREKGVTRTSLTDIASQAGVTRGAIYWHFANKADVFEAMCDRATLPLEALFGSVAGPDLDDPLATLREGLIGVLRLVEEDLRCRRVFEIMNSKCEFVDEMAATMQRRQECRQVAMDVIEKNLGLAVRRGQLSESLDVHRVAIGLFAYLDGLIHNWGLMPERYSLAGEAGPLLDLFLDGLRRAR